MRETARVAAFARTRGWILTRVLANAATRPEPLMPIVILLAFVFLPPAIAFLAGHMVDDKIWRAKIPFERAKRLAGWSWILISLIPFITGAVILVVVWIPSLRQTDFLAKVLPVMFGGMDILLGIVFVLAGCHYFFKKQ